MIWWLFLLILPAGWGTCAWYYRRIWGHRLKWWAIPLAQGALMFDRRLKDWEV